MSEQCFTSPPTQYRLYGRRFLQVFIIETREGPNYFVLIDCKVDLTGLGKTVTEIDTVFYSTLRPSHNALPKQ